MDISKQKAFDFAADLVKQLLTLSTGIILITVAFAKNIFGSSCVVNRLWLISSWIAFFVSILFGILSLMALAGTLDAIEQKTSNNSIYESNIRLQIVLQFMAFLVGLGLTITYAYKAL